MSTQLENTIRKAKTIATLFIAWNIAFFITALILKSTVASDTIGTLLFRAAFYAVGGFIILFLLKQMSLGRRSGWLRLSIITILAPLGVVAFIVFTPHLPIWFDVGQVGSALMLAAIAALILKRDIKQHFPKAAKAVKR